MSKPCTGALTRKHSHFFTQSGQFGSLDWLGGHVDDGSYRIINGSTMRIGHVTLSIQHQTRRCPHPVSRMRDDLRGYVIDAFGERDAGVPDDIEFATKPALAGVMLTRAVDAGVPAGWVAGDEVYGADPKLRAKIRTLGLGYVLNIASNQHVPPPAGRMPAAQYAASSPAAAWQRHSVGNGSKGPRWYSPRRAPLRAPLRVAGPRWRIEANFQAAKELTGLDQHQVRRWKSWHRWTTLAMLAHAFLAVATAIERDHAPAPGGLIAHTVNEFRHLFDALQLGNSPTLDTLLAWSH